MTIALSMKHVLPFVVLAVAACGGTVDDGLGRTGPGGAAAAGAMGGGTGGTGPGGGAGSGAGNAPGSSGAAGTVISCPAPTPGEDRDSDGFAAPDDCNDNNRLVNPGAFEVMGDNVDNDCDGVTDAVATPCDGADDPIPFDSSDGRALARAMGVCPRPPGTVSDLRWGIFDATIRGFFGGAIGDAARAPNGWDWSRWLPI